MSEETPPYAAVLTLRTQERREEHTLPTAVCTACGATVYAPSDHEDWVFCPHCKTTSITTFLVFLAALAWLQTHEPQAVADITLFGFEDLPRDTWPPFTPQPERLWMVDVELASPRTTPFDERPHSLLWVQGGATGPLTITRNTFTHCPAPGCEGYATTAAQGQLTCSLGGVLTAWGVHLREYADDPESYAADVADFAAHPEDYH